MMEIYNRLQFMGCRGYLEQIRGYLEQIRGYLEQIRGWRGVPDGVPVIFRLNGRLPQLRA
jgi:hypothetical protein